MAEDEMVRAGAGERDTAGEEDAGDPRPPRGTDAGAGVRPVTMFRWGIYTSAGVLAVLAAAAAACCGCSRARTAPGSAGSRT